MDPRRFNKSSFSQDGRLELKCTAILGNFFIKSESVLIRDKTTKVRMVEVKSEKVHGESEKTLGLFDDNSYREEEIFLSGTNDSFNIYQPTDLVILALISTLLLNFAQFSQT